eukprot:contig_37786_g8880
MSHQSNQCVTGTERDTEQPTYKGFQASLKEVGFPAGNDLLIDGAAYSSWVHTKNCPFKNDPEGQCKAFVSYPVAVDKLLVIYAITQKSAHDPNAAAFFSEVTLSCGCQCLGRPAKFPSVFPDGVTPGKCVSRMSTKPAYGCDFMGKNWCETVDASKWVMTDAATGTCAMATTTIQRVVSGFTPSSTWGRGSRVQP